MSPKFRVRQEATPVSPGCAVGGIAAESVRAKGKGGICTGGNQDLFRLPCLLAIRSTKRHSPKMGGTVKMRGSCSRDLRSTANVTYTSVRCRSIAIKLSSQ